MIFKPWMLKLFDPAFDREDGVVCSYEEYFEQEIDACGE